MSCRFRAAFVFVLKADETEQVWGDGDIAAIDELIAVGDELGFVDVLRVAGLAVENGLAGCGVAVCAGYGDCIAESSRTEAVTK